MNRRPRILGHVMLGLNQQRELTPGGRFEMPLAQFRETIKWEARIGDLAWVKEPWCMLMPMALAVPGHFLTVRPTLKARYGKKHIEIEFHPTGAGLHRRESRFTLEVTGYNSAASTVRFLVHECQIGHFLENERAAA